MNFNPYEASTPADVEVARDQKTHEFRSAHGLTIWASWWLLITALIETAAAVPIFILDPYLNTDPEILQREMGWSFEQVMAMFLGLIAFAIVSVVANIVGIVLFCMWVYRANKNAHALGAANMEFTPGWAVGYYFIPILNLFKPYQSVKEIYQASDADAGADNWKNVTTPGWLLAWWLVWLASNILGNIDFRMSMSNDPAVLTMSRWVTPISAGVGLLAAWLAFRVIRVIHQRQELKHEKLNRTPPSSTVPPISSWADFR